MKLQLLSVALVLAAAEPALAEKIERACMNSDRPAASRQLCGCIQDVADLTLSPSEQRKAAKFFADPHQAQETRQSSSRSDQKFWQNYRLFGESAKTYCS